MGMAILMRFWYFSLTLGFIFEGGAFLDPSTMFQTSMDVNYILILNSQRLKFSLLNLSMILVALLYLKLYLLHLKKGLQILKSLK